MQQQRKEPVPISGFELQVSDECSFAFPPIVSKSKFIPFVL